MGEVLVAEETLQNRDHVAVVHRVCDAHDRDLDLAVAEGHHWKEHVLQDGRTTSVHLLHKLPDSLVDDEVVVLFPDVSPKDVFAVD